MAERPSSPGGVRIAMGGLMLALVLAAFLRLWDLTSQSQFLDEAFTTRAAALPPAQLLQFLAQHDAHPPLFYLLAHVAMAVLRWPPTWYRFLTAPFGLLTVFATWSIARRRHDEVGAAVAALFVATAPSLLLFDRLFRMYGVFVALAVASFWLLGAAVDAQGRRRILLWSCYAVVAIALPSVQYLGALIVAAQCGYACLDLRRRWPVLCAAAGAVAALLPWIWGIREQWPQAGFSAGRSMLWAWSLARALLAYALPVTWYRGTPFDTIFGCLALAVFVCGIVLARSALLAAYVAPAALQSLLTAAFHRNLIYARYLVYLIPAYAIALGAVCSALLRTPARVAGVLIAAAALGLNGIADTNMLVDKYYQLSDWNTVGNIVAANEQRSDVFVFDQQYPYLIAGDTPAFAGHAERGPEKPEEIGPLVRWIDDHARERVWYVQNQPQYPDPELLIKQHLDATRPRLLQRLEPRADIDNMVYVALYGPRKQARR